MMRRILIFVVVIFSIVSAFAQDGLTQEDTGNRCALKYNMILKFTWAPGEWSEDYNLGTFDTNKNCMTKLGPAIDRFQEELNRKIRAKTIGSCDPSIICQHTNDQKQSSNDNAINESKCNGCETKSDTPATSSEPPKLSDLFGVWSDVKDKCQSYKDKTEGPYFIIREKSFVAEGGSSCKRVKHTLKGNRITVSAVCAEEEAGWFPTKASYLYRDGQLIDGQRVFERCSR